MRRAQRIWQDLTCAALAERMGERERSERMLFPALLLGEVLISEYRLKRIRQTDFISRVPKPIAEVLAGPAPTPKFVMGRLYEKASQEVTNLEGQSADSVQTLRTKFQELGCAGAKR
jgi:hypothetical protein